MSLAKARGAARKGRSGSIGVRKVLVDQDRKVDYHYHFSARKLTERQRDKIAFELQVVPHKSKRRLSSRHPFVRAIDNLEHWLLDILPRETKRLPLKINWRVSFSFNKKDYQPIFELPFKNPFNIPDEDRVLGDLSISGLKVEFENSAVGLSKIYVEAFPDFFSVYAVFFQKLNLKDKLVEDFLTGAEKIARLFVRKRGE